MNKTLKADETPRIVFLRPGELRLFRVLCAAAIGIGGTSTTLASIPSPTLFGVQRVVIDCGPVTGLSDVERQAFCEQLVRKADTLTDLPVSLASSADVDPTNLARQAQQLLLRVTATATSVDNSRKSIALDVTAVRAARPIGDHRTGPSTISLVKVQKDWVLQGPIPAFDKALASTRSTRMRAPLTAD